MSVCLSLVTQQQRGSMIYDKAIPSPRRSRGHELVPLAICSLSSTVILSNVARTFQ